MRLVLAVEVDELRGTLTRQADHKKSQSNLPAPNLRRAFLIFTHQAAPYRSSTNETLRLTSQHLLAC